MTTRQPEKKQYESPRLVDLSAPVKAVGAICSAGTSVHGGGGDCFDGQSANPLCKTGRTAVNACRGGSGFQK